VVYIDAHTHFGPPGKDLPPVTPEERIKLMDSIGMDAMVTTPPYSSISADRSYRRQISSYLMFRGSILIDFIVLQGLTPILGGGLLKRLSGL